MDSSLHQTDPCVLALGMVYSKEDKPKCGQQYRDRLRILELERLGYNVYSLDNKHLSTDGLPGKHCHSSFASTRHLQKNISQTWGDVSFDLIIMDYFFCPVGWIKSSWTVWFFTETLAYLSTILNKDGVVWLPLNADVMTCIEEFNMYISLNFIIEYENDVSKNPLYQATENCYTALLKSIDRRTNLTEMQKLNQTIPFCCLRVKKADQESSRKRPNHMLVTGLLKAKAEPITINDIESERVKVMTVPFVILIPSFNQYICLY
jgi:hypothetical protein